MTDPDGPGAGLELASSHDDMVRHVTMPGGQLHASTAAALVRLADELLEDRALRVITLGARSSTFCSGPAPDLDPLDLDPDPAAAWSRLRVPVIALIDGPCFSVGLELALACDIRLVGSDARLALPDLTDDRLPCWGGTQRLARAVRPAEATAMLLLGTEVGAERAVQLGLAHERFDDLAEAGATMAASLVARGPLALELAKEAVHRGAELPLRDGLRLEGDLNHQLAATDDRAEGLQAFFDKRPPDFAGR